MNYTELQVTTNFSFLAGASHPEELIDEAAALEYQRIGITDRNTLAGIVRAHTAAKTKNISIIPGCRLVLSDGPSLLAYPTNQDAYANLCSLLTTGNMRAEKGDCTIFKSDVYQYAKDLVFIVLPPQELNEYHEFDKCFIQALGEYKEVIGSKLYIAATRTYHGRDTKKMFRLHQLTSAYGVPMVATNDVHYHHPSRRELQDLLTCIREKCTIHNAGYKLEANAERHLKTQEEMLRLFRQYPQAVHNSFDISELCQFSLDSLKYQYPKEITTGGRTPQEELTMLAWLGAHAYFGDIIPEKTANAINYELAFIEQMNYAPYFLTVYDIVRFARNRGILCQGRGSAANSTICFCLGITSVNPEKFDLLFERFLSAERNEPPDIDVDFEHERREEVIQYIYRKYGRDRAAIVATVTQQHQRGAIRDVGKAMGLSVDTINKLSKSVWSYTDDWFEGKLLKELGLNPGDKHLKNVLTLTGEYMGFPRQLGQHTGGFVITDGKLSELCPILHARMENRTCIEWNKDDIDALGFMKIDVLALGMLTCIRKSFELAKEKYGLDLTLANIPQDDPEVYEMICRADTIGVFQIESRAQQSMLPRLKPRCFYDLVIEVAIVRPGPIQGDMVHPYLKRRNGEEPVTFPSKELEDILGRTLGVPLFQEQAMKIAIVAAGFTPAEADGLRRSMATFKAKGLVSKFHAKMIRGMTEKGYDREYAERVFKQLEGFGSYGFPESHAASFAQLVYVSSWLKCHYPDIFACALLNSMPMGFYQPAQIVMDAQKHDVEVRPVDINHSGWDNTLEEKAGRYHALRLGFRQIKGLPQKEMDDFISKRNGTIRQIHEIRQMGLSDATMEILSDADVFRSLDMDRRAALWELSTRDHGIGLFKDQCPAEDADTAAKLPGMTAAEHVVQDYSSTSLSLKGHPVQFVREKLTLLHISKASDLGLLKHGDHIRISGLVLVRQRPGTAKGVCFMTIEDETGYANLVIFQNIFDKYRKAILQSKLIMAEGHVQKEGDVIHVIVRSCHDMTRLLKHLTWEKKEDLPVLTLSRADERTPLPGKKELSVSPLKDGEDHRFPKARNFR